MTGWMSGRARLPTAWGAFPAGHGKNNTFVDLTVVPASSRINTKQPLSSASRYSLSCPHRSRVLRACFIFVIPCRCGEMPAGTWMPTFSRMHTRTVSAPVFPTVSRSRRRAAELKPGFPCTPPGRSCDLCYIDRAAAGASRGKDDCCSLHRVATAAPSA